MEILGKIFQRAAQNAVAPGNVLTETVQQKLPVLRGKRLVKLLRNFINSPCFHKAADSLGRMEHVTGPAGDFLLELSDEIVQHGKQFAAFRCFGSDDPVYEIGSQKRDQTGFRLQGIILVACREKF